MLFIIHCLIRSYQIIHPFYVFQIASIILWSLDDYYYYAFCIALISVLSIASTLIETKKVFSVMAVLLATIDFTPRPLCG